MLWHELNPIAQSIFLNFQELFFESIRHTHPDKDYYAEMHGEDFYYATQIAFPTMNGMVSYASDPQTIQTKCESLKNRFKGKPYPFTWFWPHDMDLPEDVAAVFAKLGFQSLGKFNSMAAEAKLIKTFPIKMPQKTVIRLVETEDQFNAFMNIIQIVYGISTDSLPAMARVSSAYKSSDKIKLYIAEVDAIPAAILLSFCYKNTVGLYNAATLEAYRKQGLLTALITHAVKNAPTADLAVTQLMADQQARRVCDQLGFQEYAHFIPLSYGLNSGI